MSDSSSTLDGPAGVGHAPRPSRRIAGRSALFLFARVGGALAAFATQIWLAHWLGADGQGRYVEAFAWLLLLSDVAVMGLSSSAMRFLTGAIEADDHGLAQGFVKHGLAFVATFGHLLSAAALGLAALLGWSLDPGLVPWVVVGVPLLACVRFSGGVALSLGWFRVAALPASLLRPLLFAVFVGLGAAFRWDLAPRAVLAVHVGIMALVLLLLQGILRPRVRSLLRPDPARNDLRTWVRTGSRVLAVTLYAGYFPEVNLLLYGAHHSSEELAVLNAGLRIAFLVQFGLVAVDKATLPGLSRRFQRGDLDAMRTQLAWAGGIKVAGALLGLVLLALAGEWLLGLFPPEYAKAQDLLLILAAGHVVSAFLGPAGKLLSLTGHESTSFRWSAAALGSAALVYAIAGTHMDLVRAAWVVTGIGAALSLVLWWRARALLGMDVSCLAARD